MKSDYIVKIVWGVEIKYSRLEMRKVRTFQRNSLEPSRMETTTVFEIKSQTQLDEAVGGGRSPHGKNFLEKVKLYSKSKWCVGNGPMSKIKDKRVVATSFLKGKKIPMHELTEFAGDQRYFVMQNKNRIRSLKKNIDEFNFPSRVHKNDCAKVGKKPLF